MKNLFNLNTTEMNNSYPEVKQIDSIPNDRNTILTNHRTLAKLAAHSIMVLVSLEWSRQLMTLL